MQPKIRTIHVYFEEEEIPTIDADSNSEPEKTQFSLLGICCVVFLSLLCIGVPFLASLLPQLYPNTYDKAISQTVTLQLSQQPTAGQVQIFPFPQIKESEQVTVTASGSLHQNATQATGLITFYNGLFTSQTVPAGTTLTGKDGIAVVTSRSAIVPAATPTSPPTDGTVSVNAYSTVAGSLGDIAAQDINQVCCNGSILAQNLYAFSGGQDAKDIPVLSKSDVSTGSEQITSQVNSAINDQARGEIRAGYILLPLDCKTNLSANHNAGDHVASAIITLIETCIPLAYFAPNIAAKAQLHFQIPQGYHLVSFSAYVAQSNVTAKGGTLIVQAVAYLKQNTQVSKNYRFAGK
jgi:hypothetical protein